MKVKNLHDWKLSPKEAVKLQEELRTKVVLRDEFKNIRTIAGFDVGIRRGKDPKKKLRGIGACVIMSYPDLNIMENHIIVTDVDYPYIPGLLSFRELPIIIPLLEEIENEPDLIMMDGQGIAHPRRFGLASHVGVILDKPSIGCAKSPLIGEYEEPGLESGSYRYIYHEGDVIGAVLRSRNGVKPIYISPGHKITVETCIDIALNCCRGYRLPEPIREAHKLTRGRYEN